MDPMDTSNVDEAESPASAPSEQPAETTQPDSTSKDTEQILDLAAEFAKLEDYDLIKILLMGAATLHERAEEARADEA